MNTWLRYLVPAVGAFVVAVVSASSSRASASSREVVLVDRAVEGGCRSVMGANGADRLCAERMPDETVVGFRAAPAGAACPAGGRAVSWGADANGNGVLDPSELEGNTFVCSHDRARGEGRDALVVTTPLAVRDGHCPAGGTLAQSGVDADHDGVLSPKEIDRATFACNRFGGPAVAATVDVGDEPPGTWCPRGGKRIAVAHEGEVARISYACDG